MSATASKVMVLGRLGREDEAGSVHDDMVERFGEEALAMFDNASDPRARGQVATVLARKALILRDLGRRDEALRTLSEVIGRFDEDENADVKMIVSEAREALEEMIDESD